jgi:hypothetical protein
MGTCCVRITSRCSAIRTERSLKNGELSLMSRPHECLFAGVARRPGSLLDTHRTNFWMSGWARRLSTVLYSAPSSFGIVT